VRSNGAPEAAVGAAWRVEDGADRDQVEDLVQVLAVALHLAVDAVEVLAPARQVVAQPLGLQPGGEHLDRLADVRLALVVAHAHLALQLAVALGLEVAEGEVLELVLDVVDAEAVRERREDLDRLTRDALLLGGRHRAQRPHVVQAIGELHQDDPDVAHHRQQHLAQVLGLLVLVDAHRELGDLGLALDDLAHRRAEALARCRRR
jgi:hypothetical protein